MAMRGFGQPRLRFTWAVPAPSHRPRLRYAKLNYNNTDKWLVDCASWVAKCCVQYSAGAWIYASMTRCTRPKATHTSCRVILLDDLPTSLAKFNMTASIVGLKLSKIQRSADTRRGAD